MTWQFLRVLGMSGCLAPWSSTRPRTCLRCDCQRCSSASGAIVSVLRLSADSGASLPRDSVAIVTAFHVR
eukprot:2019790-Rhodomonas_salina.1